MGLDSKDNIFDTDEELNFEKKYMEQLDADTPDLWDRIEQAVKDDLPYSEPINIGNGDNEPEEKKKKFITFPHMAAVLIAAAAVLVIAISSVFVLGNRSTKNGGTGADEGWWARLVSGDSSDAESDGAVNQTDDAESYDMAAEAAEEDYAMEETAGEDDNMDASSDNETADNDMEATDTNSPSEDMTTATEAPATTETPVTEVPSTETPTQNIDTENNQDSASGKYIMVNGYMYTESGDSTTELPSGFDYAGAVSSSGTGTPTQNMQGQNIPTGAGVYTSPSNNYVIYIEVSGGTYEQYVID